jgi:hypothetical protein
MKRILVVSLAVALAFSFMAGTFSPCQTEAAGGSTAHSTLPVNMQGKLTNSLNNKDANYHIRVPANWNGTLLVYAHGYSATLQPQPVDAAPGGALGEDLLLLMGYAVAGSAFSGAGWAVQEGLQDTLQLTNYFKQNVATPKHTILWGFSMGSVIALKSIEDYPTVYDGAISAGGLGAGTPKNFDQALALSLAYDAAFTWPGDKWGPVSDVGKIGGTNNGLDYQSKVLPYLPNVPAKFSKVEFMRLVCKLPVDVNFLPHYIGRISPYWLYNDMFYATQVRSEMDQRANGPVAEAHNPIYTLKDGEKAYLKLLGVDASILLQKMNNSTPINADSGARGYAASYATYTGNLTRPVITVHTRVDEVVRVENETEYKQTVHLAKHDDLLLQEFTSSVGHCNFTPTQLVTTVKAMVSWLDTGTKPSETKFFPSILGFMQNFNPGPWPLAN